MGKSISSSLYSISHIFCACLVIADGPVFLALLGRQAAAAKTLMVQFPQQQHWQVIWLLFQAAESGMVDDGKSAKEVYRVKEFDLAQVEEEDYGTFFSGDCYVVLYAYNDGRRDNYIIYYWLVCM